MASDVKWIKIVTDIFDDEKVLLIESMPEHDAVIVIWFKLLCLAGKNNNKGVFVLNERIAYTDEMLATIFRRPLNTIRMALKIFEQYGMVELINGVITIPNWGKHQTLDQIESRREYQREYMASKRKEQKTLALCEPNSKPNKKTNYKPNSETKVSPIEGDKKEKEIKNNYSEFVLLTVSEYNRFITEFGEDATKRIIEILNNYKGANGKKYASDNLAIRSWVIKRYQEEQSQTKLFTDKPKSVMDKAKEAAERYELRHGITTSNGNERSISIV